MKISLSRYLAATAACLTLSAAGAFANPYVVNCDEGDLLQDALGKAAGSAKLIEINVYGTCYEDLSFSRDDVRIYGDGNTTIVGTARFFSAKGVWFEEVNFTGPGDGLRIVDGRIRLIRSHVSGNIGDGIFVSQNGTISLSGCFVEHNSEAGIVLNNASTGIRNTQVTNNGADGIVVTNNAALNFVGGGINYHENGFGIRASNSSSIDLRDTHIGVSNPVGIGLSLGSTGVIQDSYANANAEIGILVETNSALEFIGGGISWNGLYGAYTRSHSTLSLGGVSVDNNAAHGIVVESDAALFAVDGTRVEYNTAGDTVQIECRDKESSIEIDGSVVVNPPMINCPDPDF